MKWYDNEDFLCCIICILLIINMFIDIFFINILISIFAFYLMIKFYKLIKKKVN